MSHLVFWIGISLDDLIWLALRFLEETGLLIASYPMKTGIVNYYQQGVDF